MTGRRCGGHRKGNVACNLWALPGSEPPRCHFHAGPNKVRAMNKVRAEVQAWRLTDQTVDPGTTLLRLLAQSVRRADRYAELLEQAYDAEAGGALVGDVLASDGRGGTFASHEGVRALVELEAQERDRAARFAKLAIDAALGERAQSLAEGQGALLVQAMRVLVVSLGREWDTTTQALADQAFLSIEGETA